LQNHGCFVAAGLALPELRSGKARLAEYGTVNRAATEDGHGKPCSYKVFR